VSRGPEIPFGSRARIASEGARAATLDSLYRQPGRITAANAAFRVVLYAMVGIALAGLVALLIDAFVEGQPRLSLSLLTDSTSRIAENAGFRQAILGSLWLIGLMVLMVVPLGVGAAIYMEEYAKRDSRFNRLVEVNIQNLAAVPAIVYGILGLAFIVRGPLDLGFMLYAGAITLTLLVLPTVIIAAREAIRAVPPSIREGALALGATRWQTIRHQVLPAAVPGILTGIILSVSRALGEAAPLLLFGAAIFVTADPQPFNAEAGWTALPVQIFTLAADPQAELRELAAAGIIIMLAVLVLMNSLAIWLRNRYEQNW
jgi:phosphate transport system permease protein